MGPRLDSSAQRGMTSKIAIIGCGAISELYYAQALLQLSQSGAAEVGLLFDPDAKRTARLKELFPDAAVANVFADAVKFQSELAIVASPPRFHAEQTVALLKQGTAVLCEKPMSATVVEAEAMIAAAANTKSLLAIGLFRRFFASSQLIYDIVHQGRLGAVGRFDVSEGGPFNWPAQSASFFQKSNSQGGVLSDLGVHVLDLLIWWFGMPEKVDYEDDAMGGLEANCHLELGFAGGVSGTVRLSRDTQLPNRTIIECEHGWIRCKAAAADQLEIGFKGVPFALGGQIESLDDRGPYGFRAQPALSYQQSFCKQLRNVVSAVRGQEPVFIPGEEGKLSLRLIEQCYRQRKLMRMPWLAERELQCAQKIVGFAQ